MNSKKKFIILLASISLVAVASIIALVTVLASFNAKVSGDINISYTASNVKATISASYGYTEEVGNVVKTSDGETQMVFTGEEDQETTAQNFEGITANFERDKTTIYVKYTIKNDNSSSSCKLTSNNTLSDSNNNVTITFKVDSGEYGAFPELVTITEGGECVVFVKIQMNNNTKNVSLTGGINFILQV